MGDFEGSLAREDIRTLNETRGAGWEKHESCVAWEDHNETLEEVTRLRDQLAAAKAYADDANVKLAANREQLADERAKLTQLHDEWWERVQDLNKQLAAERQLVAEREKDTKLMLAVSRENDQLREQLAAAVEALKRIASIDDDDLHPVLVADAALTRLGDGK